mgnify:CR=1 FL=1
MKRTSSLLLVTLIGLLALTGCDSFKDEPAKPAEVKIDAPTSNDEEESKSLTISQAEQLLDAALSVKSPDDNDASPLGETVMVDTVTNKKYKINNFTETLITICKDRISDMNMIGFFLAGRGRHGSIKENAWFHILNGSKITIAQAKATMKKEKVVAIESKGYDQYFILPGGNGLTIDNEGLDDELVGASKSKLKSAFAKSNKNRIQSRVLLNKFVKLVA